MAIYRCVAISTIQSGDVQIAAAYRALTNNRIHNRYLPAKLGCLKTHANHIDISIIHRDINNVNINIDNYDIIVNIYAIGCADLLRKREDDTRSDRPAMPTYPTPIVAEARRMAGPLFPVVNANRSVMAQ